MTREQALNYLKSCGMSKEQIQAIVKALSGSEIPKDSDNLSSGTRKNSKKLEKNFGELDCISRADVNRIICEYRDDAAETGSEKDLERAYGANAVGELISELPLITPIRPKGHWICDGKGRSFADYHCSECGLKLALCGQDIKQRQDSGYSLFCGGCGADMREVVEE